MSYYKEALKSVDAALRQWPHNVDLALSIANHVNENQMATKRWLTLELADMCEMKELVNPNVLIHAGWFGLVGDMIRTSKIKPNKVCIMDKDPMCQPIGGWMYPKIKHTWGKIEDWNPDDEHFDIIVLPSCEHITDETLNNFLSKKNESTLVCLTSNNMHGHEDHINSKGSVHDFSNSVKLRILKECELKLDGYTRFMIFGV